MSGGQKRRVTVAESFLSCARVYAGDEITNGLDSAVALDVVRFFVRWARETGGTFVTALQAPTPEITAAFDAVLVLAEGRVLYHVSTGQLKYVFTASEGQSSTAAHCIATFLRQGRRSRLPPLRQGHHSCSFPCFSRCHSCRLMILDAFSVFAFVCASLLSVCLQGPPSGMSRYFAAAGFPAPSYVDDADFAVQLATSPATALSLYAEDIAAAGAPAPVGTTVGALADHWERVRAAALTVSPSALAAKSAASGIVAVAPAAPPSPRAQGAGEAVAAAGAEIELPTTAVSVTVAPPSPSAASKTVATQGDIAAIVAATVAAPPAKTFSAADHPAVAAQFGRAHVHSAGKHAGLLFKRESVLYYRNMGLVMAKIMQSIVLALIFGGVFFQVRRVEARRR